MGIVAIIVAIVGVALGVLLAICLLPFRLTARGSVHEGDVSGDLRIVWAFGLVAVRVGIGQGAMLYLFGVPLLRLSGRKADKSEPQKSSDDGDGGAAILRRLIGLRRHREPLVEMIGRMTSTVGLDLTLSGTVGTGDPANDAWILFAMRAARELPGVRLFVEVEWLEETLEIDVEACARVWMVRVVAVAAWLLVRRQNRIALRAVA